MQVRCYGYHSHQISTHHLNTNGGKILWKNGVYSSNTVPETFKICALKLLWQIMVAKHLY